MEHENVISEMERSSRIAMEMLGDALRQVNAVNGTSEVDTLKVSDLIAGAIGDLFEADRDSKPQVIVGNVSATMDSLRAVLELLQVGDGEHPALDESTRIVAKTLAVLYPLSKIEVSPSRFPGHPSSSMPATGSDRREAPRMAIDAKIGFQSDTNFYMGFTEDISSGGLFISTFDLKEIGEKLNINFTLPDGHLVSADGIVRWVREYNELTPDTPPGMGIQFESIKESDKHAIDSFISERPALFYE